MYTPPPPQALSPLVIMGGGGYHNSDQIHFPFPFRYRGCFIINEDDVDGDEEGMKITMTFRTSITRMMRTITMPPINTENNRITT